MKPELKIEEAAGERKNKTGADLMFCISFVLQKELHAIITLCLHLGMS